MPKPEQKRDDMSERLDAIPSSINVEFAPGLHERYFRGEQLARLQADCRELANHKEELRAAHIISNMKMIALLREELAIKDRDVKRVEAQLAPFMADNIKLQQQLTRQAKTIAETDTALNARADRVTSLERTIERMTREAIERDDQLESMKRVVEDRDRRLDACEPTIRSFFFDPGGVARQAAADKEKDIALANAQARIKYLQDELVRLAAATKLVKAKAFAYPVPMQGETLQFHPRFAQVQARNCPNAYRCIDPEFVRLTF